MQEFMKNLNERKIKYYDQKHYLENRIRMRRAQIDRLEKRLNKLEYPHFHDALKTIGEYICEKTGYEYRILGPFGLRCESSLWIIDPNKDKGEHGIGNIVWSICVNSKTNEDNTQYLVYDTGEKKSGYHPNSLGAMNGFDNVEAILPDTIEEVWEIMKKMKERE
jgi:hypothetical protein